MDKFVEEQIIKFAKNIRLLSSLTDKELSHILKKVNLKKFKKNEIILHEKDTNMFMYIILQGKVKVIRITEDGKEVLLAMHQTGDFFGEMSLIDGKTAPATVMVTEDSHIIIISKENFYSILFNNEKVLKALLQIMSSRLRDSWEIINVLSFSNATQRIKTILFLLSGKHGEKKDNGITINTKLTHQNIASMSGVARETVTRIIDRLQKDGDITVLKNKFIHLNLDFLKKEPIL
jgi:CRP/FNR family transcriptional regulator